MSRLLVLGLVIAAFAAGSFKASSRPAPAAFQLPPAAATAAANQAPRFDSRFVSTRQDVQTHAASLIALRDGRIRAFWFSGSREGAQDVEIRSAVFDPARAEWGAEQLVASRESTQRALLRYVKKVGNPVPGRAADGTLCLFYVTVSVGGWAGSSITAMTSSDDGTTWTSPRRLVTSPFLNVSTLVKGTPFLYADGTMGLPVYHEFASKFGELLRLDRDGEVIDKQRLASGGFSLQPVVLIRSAREALALMRYSGSTPPRRVIGIATDDAGRHWTEPAKTALSNPDAAISGVALPDGRLLVALNNVEANRDSLSLVISGDGGATWRTVYQLEQQSGRQPEASSYSAIIAQLARSSDNRVTEAHAYVESASRQMCEGRGCGFEFSYPYLIQTAGGEFDLVYTWNRSFIKHVRFSRAWLDQRLEDSARGPLH